MSADRVSVAGWRMTCRAAPAQAEGTLTDGRHFYFRARHDSVSLGVGTTPTAAASAELRDGPFVRLSITGPDRLTGKSLMSGALGDGEARKLAEVLVALLDMGGEIG